MENSEIHQLVEEVGEDPERIHTKDWTQELKISSKLPREKAGQLILCAAFKKCTL